MNVTITWRHLDAERERRTIYGVLREKLGREPTNAELVADVRRILADGNAELASKGRLPFQRKRR